MLTPESRPTEPGASFALWLLIVINLFNYLDRQVLYSLLPLIQADLGFSDVQAGGLASAFMLIYMVAALPLGYLADRYGRRGLISLGVALWSLATAASGLASSYGRLFLARAAVGVGESCYGSISPSFVAEYFPARRRGWILSLYSMAIPVGSALGYAAGGALGELLGWRKVFFVVGFPGLLLAALALKLKNPPVAPNASSATPRLKDYLALFGVRSYALATLGQAAMTFALGGLAVWMPTFFTREWGMSVSRAGTLVGGVTVVAGLVGSLAGGWVSDRVLRFDSRAHFWVSGLGLLLGMPLALAAVLLRRFEPAIACFFFAEVFLFLNMGPLNAIVVAVTSPRARSMAFAANIFVIHALGDALSPTLIGWASEAWGLRSALGMTTLALGLAGAFCLTGLRTYDKDAARIPA